MTLQEVIRSGRPFKRPDYQDWITVVANRFYWSRDGRAASFTASATLSEDWIIQPHLVPVLTNVIPFKGVAK